MLLLLLLLRRQSPQDFPSFHQDRVDIVLPRKTVAFPGLPRDRLFQTILQLLRFLNFILPSGSRRRFPWEMETTFVYNLVWRNFDPEQRPQVQECPSFHQDREYSSLEAV
jgi:hypothetical protein